MIYILLLSATVITCAVIYLIVFPQTKTVQINGIQVTLPIGTKKAVNIHTVTIKAVSRVPNTYNFTDDIRRISSIQSWFNDYPDVSYYIDMKEDSTLNIGKAKLTVLHSAVKVILTLVDNSLRIDIVPGVGRLRVTGILRYKTGNDKIAGFLESEQPVVMPLLENDSGCYCKGSKNIVIAGNGKPAT